MVGIGLGAHSTGMRAGYGSLTISVGASDDWVTRICRVGPLGVNQSLGDGVHTLAQRVERGELGVAELRAELGDVVRGNQPRPDLTVALTAGVACAAFGRLLGVDWQGVDPIFAAAALVQMIRRWLTSAGLNVFVSAAAVAFGGATLCGLASRWIGSQTVQLDMAAALLLLVPGVPALVAQTDILERRPTLGWSG